MTQHFNGWGRRFKSLFLYFVLPQHFTYPFLLTTYIFSYYVLFPQVLLASQYQLYSSLTSYWTMSHSDIDVHVDIHTMSFVLHFIINCTQNIAIICYHLSLGLINCIYYVTIYFILKSKRTDTLSWSFGVYDQDHIFKN